MSDANSDDPLYLGAAILQKSNDESGGEYWSIVDGQQRITTICLLLIACRNLAVKNMWPQATTLPSLIASQNIAIGETTGLRVQVGQNISAAYEFMVRNPDWNEAVFPPQIDGRVIDRRKARIVRANYLFFKEQIEQYTQEQISELLTKLLTSTFFLVVEVDQELQAYDIFERTNARGAPLNIGDLLKNRLFANGNEIPELQSRWDKIVTDSDTKLPRILKYFDSLSNGHDTSKSVLFQHLRDTVRGLGPAVFMERFEEFAKFFNSIDKHTFTTDPTHRINSSEAFSFLYGDETFFRRVKRSMDALSLFGIYVAYPAAFGGLLALQRFSEQGGNSYSSLKSEYIKTLNTIECFHFINNQICTSPTNRVEPLYAVAAKMLTQATSVSEAKQVLRELRTKLKAVGIVDYQTFEAAFKDKTYYPTENKAEMAYIFDRLHQSPFVITTTLNIYEPRYETVINGAYEIEHIGPIATWQGEEESLHNIGNLLVLTLETNRLAGALPLQEKLQVYRERGYDSLKPVQDFAEYIRDNKIKDMTPDIVSERASSLARLAYNEVWEPWRD